MHIACNCLGQRQSNLRHRASNKETVACLAIRGVVHRSKRGPKSMSLAIYKIQDLTFSDMASLH